MFTVNEIQKIHSKVKSGADFPNYIKELIELGVTSYDMYVTNGHADYYGKDNFTISSEAKYHILTVSEMGNIDSLKHTLKIHQQGQTDYPTFCKQSAEAGVEKWTVDMQLLLCTYYDRNGKSMIVEKIPMLQ